MSDYLIGEISAGVCGGTVAGAVAGLAIGALVGSVSGLGSAGFTVLTVCPAGRAPAGTDCCLSVCDTTDFSVCLDTTYCMSESSPVSRLTDREIAASSLAGTSLVSAGFFGMMGIITAEVLYPMYTTRQEISDLGATRPPESLIYEPAATIFNSTMVLTGALAILAAVVLYRTLGHRLFVLALGLFGTGAVGVGLFPGNMPPWHGLFALLTFFSGGLAAVFSTRVVTSPFSILCGLIGGTSLLVLVSVFAYELVLAGEHPLAVLGVGGIERWVVYPLILWTLAFGGYLLGAVPEAGDSHAG